MSIAGVENTKTERSFIAIKPDGVQRGLVGEIIKIFENKGFKLCGLKGMVPTQELAAEHYKDLASKPFFKGLCDYICSGPIVAMCWEGKGVIKTSRLLIGATNPSASGLDTIRGRYAVEVGRNVIHGSDSFESAERELALWFGADNLYNFDAVQESQIYE